MPSPRRVRLVAASLVLGVTAALPAAVSGPAGSAEPDVSSGAVSRGHDDVQRKKGKVVWDSTSFYANTASVAAHGRVPGGKKRVKLQVKLPGGWHTFAKTKSSRKGKFSISGRLDWYGAHKVRVATSGKRAFKRSTTVSVHANYSARGNPADHAFTIGDRGLRYSFDPCRTVRYVVNADDVGPAGIVMAQVAVAQLSAATGIKVKYAGTSHEISYPNKQIKLPRRQHLLISWADRAEVPEFVSTPAIGFGGPDKIFWGRDGRGRRVLLTTQAGVVLDSTSWYDTNTYSQSFAATKPTWGEVMLHELGHAFGLAHVSAADEIMYPSSGVPYPDGYYRGLYGAGDLAGLAAKSLGQGCIHKARGPGNRARVAMPLRQP